MSATAYFEKSNIAPSEVRPVLVEVDAAYVPMVCAAIETRKARSFWASDDDHGRGYDALCKFQENLLMSATGDIVAAIDRVYMAIRQQSAGEVFATDVSGNPPAIPTVPPPLPWETEVGLLQILRDMQGIREAGIFGVGETHTSLADVWSALRPAKTEVVQEWKNKLDLLKEGAEVSAIWNAFRGTVEDTAIVGEGAGTLALLFIGIGTVAATMGVQAGQMDRLIEKVQALVDVMGSSEQMTDGVTTIAGELDATRVRLS